MALTQRALNEAIAGLVAGSKNPTLSWNDITEAIRAGDIVVTATKANIILTVPPAPAIREYMNYLEDLRVAAGRPSQATIAEAIGVSDASISRLWTGHTLGSWPTSQAVILYLDGDTFRGRQLFNNARVELRRNPRR